MRRLDTIQQAHKLNNIYSLDDIGPGNAYHRYEVYRINSDTDETCVGMIQMQKGPRNNSDSIPGCIDSDLLEIVRDRLKQFQTSEFACEENNIALQHVESALWYLNKRVQKRAERGILGTYIV